MIKKLVLASAMAAAPLMAAGPEEPQATKKRINIEHENGFKFKKIHSEFAKNMLNWTGNLMLLGVFLGSFGLGWHDRGLDIEFGNRAGRGHPVYGTALNVLFAIGCKLASDKLFTDKEDKAVVSSGQSLLTHEQLAGTVRKQLSSEETAQQDQVA